MMRVAIIGAGMAGLTAACMLKTAGLSPVIFDKGRGVGGRMSTRRAEGGLQFDHGAQYLSADDPAFQAVLDGAIAAGAARTWSHGGRVAKVVGTPGMSAIPKSLAAGLDLRQGVEVDAIAPVRGGWSVAGMVFDRVISTAPAPQARALIGPDRPCHAALDAVEMEPNLTLMLALPPREEAPFVTRRDPDDAIAWIALDSAKQNRPGPECWVAQASPDWSKAHLELEKDEIATRMLPLVCDRLGAEPADALYVSAHRWRYAQASKPLGQPYLCEQGTLFVGGDWALSARAEGAWQSGTAMAKALLETR